MNSKLRKDSEAINIKIGEYVRVISKEIIPVGVYYVYWYVPKLIHMKLNRILNYSIPASLLLNIFYLSVYFYTFSKGTFTSLHAYDKAFMEVSPISVLVLAPICMILTIPALIGIGIHITKTKKNKIPLVVLLFVELVSFFLILLPML